MTIISHTLSRIYIKYIMKSKILFCAFLTVGVVGFLAMTLSVKFDIVTKYDAYFDENKVIINEELYDIDSFYIYRSLNEKVYHFSVQEIEHLEQYTILYVDNEDENIKKNLLGNVSLEIVTGEQSLFELIYIKAGDKSDEQEFELFHSY